jgi:hypothetical protein
VELGRSFEMELVPIDEFRSAIGYCLGSAVELSQPCGFNIWIGIRLRPHAESITSTA